jgi:uncharacterized membrane protein YhaH (DUF805 family)
MLGFTEAVSPRDYLIWSAAGAALFALTLAVHPQMVGAAAAFLRPVAAVLFFVSLIGPAIGRSRDAGLPAWSGLLIPLLFVLDYPFFLSSPASWVFNLTVGGALHSSWPIHASAGLLSMLALGLLPTGAASRDPKRLELFGAPVAALAVILVVLKLGIVLGIRPLSLADGRLSPPDWPISRLQFYLLAALVAGQFATVIALRSTTGREVDAPTSTAHPRWRSLLPLAAALLLAALAVALASPFEPAPHPGAKFPLSAFSPVGTVFSTTALYLLAVFGVVFLRQSRWLVGGSFTLGFVVALGTWSADHLQATEVARERALATTRPPASLASYPPILVYASPTTGQPLPVIAGITSQITRGGGGYVERILRNGRWSEAMPLSQLPPRYLLLKPRSMDSTSIDSASMGTALSVELVLVANAQERFVAELHDVSVMRPTWLPVVTTYGWGRADIPPTNLTDRLGDFIATALEGAEVEKLEVRRMRPKP